MLQRILIAILCFTLALSTVAQGNKHPIPNAAGRGLAEIEIKGLFKRKYSQPRLSDKRALAVKLLKLAKETNDDITAKYVLLKESNRIASEAGDARTAFQAIIETSIHFKIDSMKEFEAALTTAAKATNARANNEQIAQLAIQMVAESVAEDQYDAAKSLMFIVNQTARKARDRDILRTSESLGKEVIQLAAEHDRLMDAFKVLRTDRKDPKANVIAGKFLCLVKGQWDKGLVMMAKSDDNTIKGVAHLELSEPTDADIRIELGNEWRALAAKEAGIVQVLMKRRAVYWYKLAYPDLSGLTKATIQKRLSEKIPDLVLSLGGSVKRLSMGKPNVMLTFEPSSMVRTGNRFFVRSGNIEGVLNGSRIVPGKVGMGVELDGKDDSVSLSNSNLLLDRNEFEFSVAMWILPTAVGRTNFLLHSQEGNFSIVRLFIRPTPSISFGIAGNEIDSPVKLDRSWHHLVAVWDQGFRRLYMDGELLGDEPVSRIEVPAVFRDFPMAIGSMMNGCRGPKPKREQRCFAGKLDEFALFDRPLSSIEARTLYEMGMKGTSLEELYQN